MQKYLVEFIGTFFLVTAIGCAVVGEGSGALAPLAIGAMLMVMVYAGGHISGAHYNPAVTLAVTMRGKCSFADVPGYVIAQCAGAAVAAMVVRYLRGNPDVTAMVLKDTTQALVAEFLFTLGLAYVVLNVATAKGTSGNSFYGLAIGFTVVAGAFAVGNISGGAFNPAVAIGATVLGLFNPANLWIYLVGNFGGAAAAAILFKIVNPPDDAN